MIKSPNLSGVIGRLSRAQAALPRKIKEAVAPEAHVAELRVVAFEALTSLVETPEELSAVPILMESFSASETESGSSFSLTAFPWSALAEAFDPLQFNSNDTLRQRVVDWVQRFKEKDERDKLKSGEPLSAAQIATRVVNAIIADPEPWLRTDESGKGALNPEGLARITGLTGMTNEQSGKLLLGILASWVAYMRINLPSVAIGKIREAFTE